MWYKGRCIAPNSCPQDCPHGQVWNECGSPCNQTCENEARFCIEMCQSRCECPKSKPALHEGKCIQRDDCPRTPVTDRPRVPDRHAKCETTDRRNITWPATDVDTIATMPCPNNQDELAQWLCTSHGWKGKPDLSRCKSHDVGQLELKALEALQELKDLQHLVLDPTLPNATEIIAAKEQAAVELIEEVADDLVTVSARPMAETYGGDVDGITWVMQEMVNEVEVQVHDISAPKRKQVVEKVNQAVIRTSNNMLDKDKQDSWLDLPQATQAEAATRVISSVDNSAYQLANVINEPTARIEVQVNLVVEVNIIDTRSEVMDDVCFHTNRDVYAGTGWQDNTNSITLSANSIKKLGVEGLAKVIFSTYKNIEQYLSSVQADDRDVAAHDEARHDDNYKYYDASDKQDLGLTDAEYAKMADTMMKDTLVNTQVIAASVNGRTDTRALAEPVFYTLEHTTKKNVFNPTCSFWEYSEKSMTGKWSTFGCEVHDTNTTHTVCKCKHLTNFAVLMDVSATPLTEGHAFALAFITYVGCFISLVCLLLAWITFTFIRNMQCDRNTIHKNLVCCLFIAEIVFLAGIGQADKPGLCSVVAGLLHYFFLASFAWMCLEGVQLYVMLIEVFEAERSRKLWYYLSGYGVPAVIVGITAAVDYTGYGTDTYCWLSTDGGFIWAFVGPVIAVMVVNSVMLGVAIYMMCRHARATAAWKMKQKTRSQNVRSWIKGAFVLVVLLGLTWTFGLVYVNQETLFMAYVFTILNSLQGLFIYLFHCVYNDKVQKEYKKLVRKARWLPECIRVKYGGARSSTYSPNQSSSSGNALQRLLSNRFRKRSSTTSLPKSTTQTTPGKWNYHDMQENRNSASHERANLMNESSTAPDSAFYSEVTEDPNGYLEPKKCLHSAYDCDDIAGEFSNIEGSVCDTDYFEHLCSPSKPSTSPLAIDVDKYKIKPAHSGKVTRAVPLHKAPLAIPERNRLAVIPQESDFNESEYSDGELFSITDKERHLSPDEELAYRRQTESEIDLIEALSEDSDDSIKKRPLSSDSGNMSPSLNDLNKLDLSLSSQEDLNLSTPNIKFKKPHDIGDYGDLSQANDSKKRSSQNSSDDSMGRSHDYAVSKLKTALSRSNEGLVSLYQGQKVDQRLSKDTQHALDQHGLRLSSSDC